MSQAWVFLIAAGLLEIGWALLMKNTEGFTRFWPSVATLSVMVASFYFLAHSLKSIPIGTAYAVWTGIGAAGTAVIGMILFKEPTNVARLVCLGMVVVGIAGLKWFGN